MPNGLQFITENPVTGAFRRGQQNAREGRLAETKQAEADAILTERLATAPERVEQSRLTTAANRTANRLSRVKADIAEQTRGQAIFDANNPHAGEYIELSFGALKDGDIPLANHYAELGGDPIPPEVLANREYQQVLVRFNEEAKEKYSNSPRKRQQYVEARWSGWVNSRAERGLSVNVPVEFSPTMPAGAPALAEVANTKAKQLPSDVEAAEWLAQNTADSEGRPVTPSDKVSAFEFIRQAKSDPNKQAEMVIRVAAPLLANRRDRRPVEEKIAEATKAVEDILAASQPSIESPNTPVQILPPAPVEMADRVVGQIYSARNGQKVLWDGKGWKVAP